MRRFLIWSGLAVVIGLVLAVGGFIAYDQLYARFQPVTIVRGQDEIQRLLDEASWVSPGGGDQPLYIIGFRDSPSTQAYQRQEAEKLRAGGVDVRVLMFARPNRDGAPQSSPTERATIAQLWLTRDWNLYQQWAAVPVAQWTAPGIAPADGDLARSAVVEASRQFVQRLDILMRDAGVKPTWPLVIWRDRQGFLKACACADSRSWAFIRDDLGAPDRVDVPAVPLPEETPFPPTTPAPTQTEIQGLPYPNLTPIPPATTGQPQTGPATPNAVQPNPQSTQPSVPRSTTPRQPQRTPPTQPRRQTGPKPIPPEDTQFF